MSKSAPHTTPDGDEYSVLQQIVECFENPDGTLRYQSNKLLATVRFYMTHKVRPYVEAN